MEENCTSADMDESTFTVMAQRSFQRVMDRLDEEDPDVVEADMSAGVLKIQFPDGTPYILNTQRPVRELWLAAGKQAWHFRYDGQSWVCPKTQDEIFSRLAALISERTGLRIVF